MKILQSIKNELEKMPKETIIHLFINVARHTNIEEKLLRDLKILNETWNKTDPCYICGECLKKEHTECKHFENFKYIQNEQKKRTQPKTDVHQIRQ